MGLSRDDRAALKRQACKTAGRREAGVFFRQAEVFGNLSGDDNKEPVTENRHVSVRIRKLSADGICDIGQDEIQLFVEKKGKKISAEVLDDVEAGLGMAFGKRIHDLKGDVSADPRRDAEGDALFFLVFRGRELFFELACKSEELPGVVLVDFAGFCDF